MYTRSLAILAAAFGLASTSPLHCPGTSVFSAYTEPASLICSCFSPPSTVTSTTTSTVTTQAPTATSSVTSTKTGPTSTVTDTATSTTTTTTDSTIIPDTVTLTVQTTVTTTTLNCFTTGGVQSSLVLAPAPAPAPLSSALIVLSRRAADHERPVGKTTHKTTEHKTTKTVPQHTTKPTTKKAPTTSPTNSVCSVLTKPAVSSALSSACSCIGALSSPSTTIVASTTTSTKAQSTTTTTVTTTSTPVTTTTTTATQTDTATSTVLGTVTSTLTVVSTVNVATASPTGIPYYFYQPLNPTLDDGTYDNAPDVVNSLRNNDGYVDSGTISNLNSISSRQYFDTPDGTFESGTQYGFIFQGYLLATDGPGEYTITSRANTIDNVGIVWDGDNAYQNNWTYDNSDYVAGFPDGSAVTLTLLANEARPINIAFLNAGAPGVSDFVITSPTGTTYLDTSPLLFADCGNNNFNP